MSVDTGVVAKGGCHQHSCWGLLWSLRVVVVNVRSWQGGCQWHWGWLAGCHIAINTRSVKNRSKETYLLGAFQYIGDGSGHHCWGAVDGIGPLGVVAIIVLWLLSMLVVVAIIDEGGGGGTCHEHQR